MKAVSPHAICVLLPNLPERPSQCISRKEALLKNLEEKSVPIIAGLAKVTRSVKVVTKWVEDKMIGYCLSNQ